MTHTRRMLPALLAPLAIAACLLGCNSRATAGHEYLGNWQHTTTFKNSYFSDPSKTATATNLDTLTITKEGDHFLVREIRTMDDGFGKTANLGTHTTPAIITNGILQLADGSSQPYTYVKSTDTLVTRPGEHDIEYHRSK